MPEARRTGLTGHSATVSYDDCYKPSRVGSVLDGRVVTRSTRTHYLTAHERLDFMYVFSELQHISLHEHSLFSKPQTIGSFKTRAHTTDEKSSYTKGCATTLCIHVVLCRDIGTPNYDHFSTATALDYEFLFARPPFGLLPKNSQHMSGRYFRSILRCKRRREKN